MNFPMLFIKRTFSIGTDLLHQSQHQRYYYNTTSKYCSSAGMETNPYQEDTFTLKYMLGKRNEKLTASSFVCNRNIYCYNHTMHLMNYSYDSLFRQIADISDKCRISKNDFKWNVHTIVYCTWCVPGNDRRNCLPAIQRKSISEKLIRAHVVLVTTAVKGNLYF